MALSNAFLEELRMRTPLAALVGRRVKLQRSGRNWKGCCPFHGERTPSFYVYDDGYHCFGCGAHGDAIGFAMQTQNLEFIDAVRQLAAEAGLEVPKPTPEAAVAERRRMDLHDVLSRAETAFQRRLSQPEGEAARLYLKRRGLTEETIRVFGIGWSGAGRGGLIDELGRDGVEPAMLREAGLLRETEDGRLRELFYDRVMFPIRDRLGKVISFGGRILGDGQPKYVNGPETPLFSKRRTLYGLDRARAGLREGHILVVVEGYMDVIALHQAGFTGAVAPLGTALTEDQLEALWKLSPMPVLCFDGDAAGSRAALRAADLALPLLSVARSLRLVTLSGQDPDSLIRTSGPAAFAAALDAAKPLSEALYGMMAEGMPSKTPEQRAALQTRLVAAAKRIKDPALSREYRQALLDTFFNARRTARGRAGGMAPPAMRHTRPALQAAADGAVIERLRILCAILLRHPALLHDVGEAFETLALPDHLGGLRDAVLDWADAAEELDSKGLADHLTRSGWAAEAALTLGSVPMPLPACAAPSASPAEAEAGWWHIFGLLNRERLEHEVRVARDECARDLNETTQRKLLALSSAYAALRRGEQGPESDG
jgi:DNA primase